MNMVAAKNVESHQRSLQKKSFVAFDYLDLRCEIGGPAGATKVVLMFKESLLKIFNV